LNVLRAGAELAPMAALPAGVTVEAMARAEETRLGPWLLALALTLLAVDRAGDAGAVGAAGGGRHARGARPGRFWPSR
jgi:hypothetical protein